MLETPFWQQAAASLPAGVRHRYSLQLQGAERFERRLDRLVRGWRAVLLDGTAPPLRMMALLYVVSLVAVFVGAHVYRKLRPSFADVL